MTSPPARRSVVLNGRKTSVSLEDDFWEALKEIAKYMGCSISDLISTISASRPSGNLSSEIRVFVLQYYLDHQMA